MPTPDLPAHAHALRARDPDRFFTALFAPPERRDALFLLYAFNHELARARDVASEPMLALIRLQWWREVVEGTAKRHELATPLLRAIEAGQLDRARMLTMIEGREAEAYGAFPTVGAWRRFVYSIAGALAEAAAVALGAEGREIEKIGALGAAYGAAGQIRNARPLALAGRCLLPLDALAHRGLVAEAVTRDPDDPALALVLDDLRAAGREWLAAGRGPARRNIIAAALPGVLARRDLSGRATARATLGTADRLAILAAALLARI